MERLGSAAKKAIIIVLFALLCIVALLYGVGVFDFTFIHRDLPISGKGASVIDTPDLPDDDKQMQEQMSNLGVGDNISAINPGFDTSSDTEPVDTGDEEEIKVPYGEEFYPALDAVKKYGYLLSTDSYNRKKTMIAELTFSNPLTRDQVKGKVNTIVDAPLQYEDGGERFYNTEEREEYLFAVQPYMGYILINERQTIEIYRNNGTYVTYCDRSELTPAYVRDTDGNPLFIDSDGNYYYFNEDNLKATVDKNALETDKGLYIDSPADFGESDSELQIYSRYEYVNFRDELDTTDYYILSSVDADLAYSIQKINPHFASKIARNNPRFSEALEAAKKQIEREENPETENILTIDTEELASPDTEADIRTETEITTEANVFTGEPVTVPVTAPETEVITETETEAITETEPETEIETEMEAELTADGILIINRRLYLPRYAYGTADADASSLDYKYAKAYNFREGLAAVVDDDGILRFINEDGEIVIDGVGTKMVTASRYITTEYAEPLCRHTENSKGYLYFDNGLVRVRKLERDYTYKNLIYSDSDVLLYSDGSEFKIPHGFTLIAYSEGVLVELSALSAE